MFNNDCKDFIAVVSTQRSGSTWLMQVIDNLKSVDAYGEIFREITSDEFAGDPKLKPEKMYYDYLSESYISASDYLDEQFSSNDHKVAFKIMYDQIWRDKSCFPMLFRKDLSIVHLIRHDVFAIATSKFVARSSGVWHSASSVDYTGFNVSIFDFKKQIYKELLKKFLAKILFRFVYVKTLELSYEKLTSGDVGELTRFASFMGMELKDLDMSTKWKKQSDSGKSNAISNYKELQDWYSSSKLVRLINFGGVS